MKDHSLVLVFEPDASLARELCGLLRASGYDPVTASSLEEAVETLTRSRVLLTLVDVDVAPLAASELRRQGVPGPVVQIGNGHRHRVLDVNEPAGDEVVPKSHLFTHLESVIQRAVAAPRRLAGPGDDPWARLAAEVSLWRSPRMQAVWEMVQQAARVDVTVLVCGETGTGKDVIARAIHHLSARRSRPFVKVNCAAVPRELLESELFGHERGSFTGAHRLRVGQFEAASHGTVFLDEIGDLHPALQAKLLHVLQDGSFSRVGGKSAIKVDVRVLAATNKDLERAVAEHRFREDLYYRLNVIQVTVPPLRDRVEEIPLLVDYFVHRYGRVFNREQFRPDPSAVQRLVQHRYPGNVRELENIVKRMIVLSDPFLARTPLASPNGAAPAAPAPNRAAVKPASLKDIAREAARTAERDAMLRALEEVNWNRVRAARLLRISYRALLYKMKDAGLQRHGAVLRTSP